MNGFQLFDVVALTEPLADKGLQRGQVGTVVDIYADGACEVDFSDSHGQTYALLAVQKHSLMRLYDSPVPMNEA